MAVCAHVAPTRGLRRSEKRTREVTMSTAPILCGVDDSRGARDALVAHRDAERARDALDERNLPDDLPPGIMAQLSDAAEATRDVVAAMDDPEAGPDEPRPVPAARYRKRTCPVCHP